jgi:hypothetical protein
MPIEMDSNNTIIIILGDHGHEYVAEVGNHPVIVPVLSRAAKMTHEQADEVIKKLGNCRAVRRDVDEYLVEIQGRVLQVDELRRQLPAGSVS